MKLHCHKCDHEWIPRYHKPPKVCPLCKRIDWAAKPSRKMTHLQWLVRARKMAGISQKEMAHRLGISTPYLCQIEAGRRRPTAVFNLIYSGL